MKKVMSILFLICVVYSGVFAQPQSFFISPWQTISYGTIVRAYCLEYSKEVLSIDNLTELTRFTGMVTVIYKNGLEVNTSFQELYRNEKIEIFPFSSYEHMQFLFLDESIAQINIGNDGIGLFRDELTEYEKTLTTRNIQKILELEARGLPHSEVQQNIWRTREVVIDDRDPKKLVIDLQTTEREEDKVHSTFNTSSTVSYRRGGRTFLRIDGLLDDTGDTDKNTDELITHYHNDHINHSVVLQTLDERNFNRMIGPYSGALHNDVFSTLDEFRKNTMADSEQVSHILDITSDGIPLPLRFIQIGDFSHCSYRIDQDTVVEMFKYQNPLISNQNDDGLIYQITHKNVKWLVFGDFDYIRGIENLLDASAVNEKRRIEIMEELSNLQSQRLIALKNKTVIEFNKILLEEIAQDPEASHEEIEEQQEMTELLVVLTILLQERIAGLENEIISLNEELRSLPILKADIIKWPHHAHRFPETGRADSVIKKLNEVVDPQYIIWQRYNNQSAEKFEDYVERLGISDKCFNSDDREITIISMLEYFTGRRTWA